MRTYRVTTSRAMDVDLCRRACQLWACSTQYASGLWRLCVPVTSTHATTGTVGWSTGLSSWPSSACIQCALATCTARHCSAEQQTAEPIASRTARSKRLAVAAAAGQQAIVVKAVARQRKQAAATKPPPTATQTTTKQLMPLHHGTPLCSGQHRAVHPAVGTHQHQWARAVASRFCYEACGWRPRARRGGCTGKRRHVVGPQGAPALRQHVSQGVLQGA